MAARARRARPGHARRARAREGREDSHLALMWFAFFLGLACFLDFCPPLITPAPCEVSPPAAALEDGAARRALPDNGHG